MVVHSVGSDGNGPVRDDFFMGNVIFLSFTDNFTFPDLSLLEGDAFKEGFIHGDSASQVSEGDLKGFADS